MKKYRILLVSPFPPPFGGIARYSEDLFEGLMQAGLDVKKYNTSCYEKLRYSNMDRKRNYLRIFQVRNILFLLAIVFDWIPYMSTLLVLRPNIVHVHTSSYWGWWRSTIYIGIARLLGLKTVLHIHNAIDRFYFEESGKIGKYLIRCSLNIPHHLITLSEGIQRLISGITSKSITPIYNGIDTKQFVHNKEYRKPYRLLFAGFVGSHKGVPDLLHGLKMSGLNLKEIMLTVVGNGDVMDMMQLTKDLGIEQQVCFTGIINEEKKRDLFKSHHIFILPSYGEGQPISILEGMAAGMAIVSTRVGSIPEIIRDNVNGFLIKPGDTKTLGRIILRLMDVELLKEMGTRNRLMAKEKFDYSRVIKDNIAVYQKMLNA